MKKIENIRLFIFIYLFIPCFAFSLGNKEKNVLFESNHAIALSKYDNSSYITAYVKNNLLQIELFKIGAKDNAFIKNELINFNDIKYKNENENNSEDDANINNNEENIFIGGAYKLNIIDKSIFLYNEQNKNGLPENIIYKIDILKDNEENYIYSVNIIAENVKKTQFINKDDYFYITAEGNLFFYDYKNGTSVNCNINLDKGIETAVIINKNKIQSQQINEWYGKLKESFVKMDNQGITDIDEKTIINYFELNKFTNNTRINKYENLKQWKENIFDKKIQEMNNEREIFISGFKSKWNISSPQEVMFVNFDVNAKNYDIKRINTSNRLTYNGNDDYIKFLIATYYKTIDFYSDKNISVNTQKKIEDLYIIIRNELFKTIDKENEKIKLEYENGLKKIDENFKKEIASNFDSIYIENINKDFGYLALQKSSAYDSDYLLLFKSSLDDNIEQELVKFKKIGNDVNIIGIYNKYIYVCENKTISFYDPFNLSIQQIKNTAFNQNNRERILFLLDNDSLITMTSNNKYNIKKIDLVNNDIKLININQNIFSNNKDGINIYDYPFYIMKKDDYIYVNSKKNEIKEGLIIKNDHYLYLENNTGIGILLERSKI